MYRLKPRDLRPGMEVFVNYGPKDDVNICMGIEPLSAAISFSGLTNAKVDYTVELTVTTRGGEVLKKSCPIKAGTKSRDVAAEVLKAFARPRFSTDRWSAVLGPNQYYLWIDGYYKGDKFEVVDKVEVKCPELSEALQRPVLLVNKAWSKLPETEINSD